MINQSLSRSKLVLKCENQSFETTRIALC